MFKNWLGGIVALALGAGAPGGGMAVADEAVVLRVHHFMSAKTTLHEEWLLPLGERLARASGGRLRLEVFHSMALGGRPGDLFDQAVDGAVDVALTLPGYTPGRFNHTEVFELPFMIEDSVAASGAFWDLIAAELQDGEFADVKVLAGWVHGPGVIHSQKRIERLEDMVGVETRGPTRVITDYLGEIGALPVGMPLPQIPESLSKGVIGATLLPWEVTPSIRLSELVGAHTELGGERALYTATFVLAMNWEAYEALPADLRAILDAETGKALSRRAGRVQAGADAVGRRIAVEENGNWLARLDAAETARWEEAAAPVYARWVARAREAGFDGEAAIVQARALIAANR